MTVFLPLGGGLTALPQSPPFLLPSPDPENQLKRVIKTILKARRIAVVCGAGISVQAGIPDFRSPDGLFQSLKKDNPALTSGKDLFDASVFNAEDTTALFCQMIARLSELSESAEPTPFHKLLRALDDRGKLLRVYTQNIDALESKSGLTFGVPKPSSSRSKVKPKDGPSSPTASQSRQPSPPVEMPRVIPLHGTLETLHCVSCTHAYPLRDHLVLLNSGVPPHCPECTALEETRQLIGKRSRGVGKLRPSVVLYNEVHKNGEQLGEAVRKDLVGNSKGKGRKRSGADLLLVVGTSLRVPGTKRIVREFSKVIRSRSNTTTIGEGGLPTPAPSPRRSPVSVDEDGPVTSIYLNLDFPVPTREWEGIFDVWIKGDAQTFAQALHAQMDKDARAKEASLERKRKREEAEHWKATGNNPTSVDVLVGPTHSKKRKVETPLPPVLPTKKRKITTFSDNLKRVTRLSSCSDDDDESGYTRPKIYLRIPARPHCTVPPAAPPGGFLVPEVVIQNTPLSLPYMSRRRPVVTPASLRKLSARKKKAARTNVGHRRKTYSLAKSKRKEAAASLSPEVVRNAQYGLRKRGGGDQCS